MNGQDTRRHERGCQNVMGNRQDGMGVKVRPLTSTFLLLFYVILLITY